MLHFLIKFIDKSLCPLTFSCTLHFNLLAKNIVVVALNSNSLDFSVVHAAIDVNYEITWNLYRQLSFARGIYASLCFPLPRIAYGSTADFPGQFERNEIHNLILLSWWQQNRSIASSFRTSSKKRNDTAANFCSAFHVLHIRRHTS